MEPSVVRRSRLGLPDYLERARTLASEFRFEEAKGCLHEATKLPELSVPDISRIFEEQRELDDRMRAKVRELAREVEQRMARTPDAAAQLDLDLGQEALARLKLLTPQLGARTPELKSLEERWQEFRRRVEKLLGLEGGRRKLQELWSQPYTRLHAFDEALALAQRMKDANGEEPLALELLSEAQSRRAEARTAQGILGTAEVDGDFKTVLSALERFAREGVQELPRYDWGAEWKSSEGKTKRSLVQGEDVPFRQALHRVRELAQQFQDDKATEYLELAEGQLEQNPAAAAERIREAGEFEYLSPLLRDQLAEFQAERIAPALQRRERARAIAQRALEPDRPPLEAWGLVSAAEELDAYTPLIASARSELLAGVRLQLEAALRRGEELRRDGELEGASTQASFVRKMAGSYGPLQDLVERAKALAESVGADRRLQESIRERAATVRQLVDSDLAAAAYALAELEGEVSGRPERFQQLLLAPRAALQQRQSLEALLGSWDRRFRRVDIHAGSAEPLRLALDDLSQLEDEVLAELAKRGASPPLQDLVARLDARRRLLEGRREYSAGLFDRALAAWKEVAEGPGEDATLALEWLARAEDDSAVAEALRLAEARREEGKYGSALELLAPWRTQASSKNREVLLLCRDLEEAWAAQLTEQIEAQIATGHPVYTQLAQEVEALRGLRPNEASRYEREHLVPIYEEWGDRYAAGDEFSKAEEQYRQAAALSMGRPRVLLDQKLRVLGRRQKEREIDDLLAQGGRQEGREQLAAWLRAQEPFYVPGLHWLASLLLEEGQIEPARVYLRQLENRLDAAERAGDPTLAGLHSLAAIVRWRRHLSVLGERTLAQGSILEMRRLVAERLRPEAAIREYRTARASFAELLESLDRARLGLEEGEPALAATAASEPQPLDDRVPGLQEVQRWFEDQLRATGLRAWFADAERQLLEKLRERWRRTETAGLAEHDLRVEPPPPELLERWRLGLKIRFLFAVDEYGEEAMLEISEAQSILGRVVRDLRSDPRGPSRGVRQESLEPRAALEAQLQWGGCLRGWAAALADLLVNFVWAAGGQEAARGAGEPEPAGAATAEIRNLKAQIEEFVKTHFDLLATLQEGERRLARAIAAGRDGQTRWEHVRWRDLAAEVVPGLRTPAPREGDRGSGDIRWADLDSEDPDVCLAAWLRAVEVVGMRGGGSDPLRSARPEIDGTLREIGVEEGWEEVDAALRGHLAHQHRVVRWLTRLRDQARAKRNQLVEARIRLAVLVNAEEHARAIELMEWMTGFDREDQFGFRSGDAIGASEALDWGAWRAAVGARRRQLEAFHAWLPEAQGDALSAWLGGKRAELLDRVARAQYEDAAKLGRDLLEGTKEGNLGRTQDGGGLALAPLLAQIETPPREFETPLSQRLRRELREAEERRRVLRVAVGELRYWLDGVGGRVPEELAQPLAKQEEQFRSEVDRLGRATQLLAFPGRWRRLWWRWQPRGREEQRRFCREVWEDLRRIAPLWPGLEARRRAVEEA